MTNTTNYDLILVEGSDKVNPLTQVNPNFESIDAQMKKNADAGVSTATELLTGSIHGLSRVNADAPMFRFTATSNYTAGDTFTVDGVQVTALTPTGEALGNGAYIIGSEVLCCLKGTLLTMFLSGGAITTADNALKLGGEEPSYYGKAEDVTSAQQTATAAGVLANAVQTQVTALESKVSILRQPDYDSSIETRDVLKNANKTFTAPSDGILYYVVSSEVNAKMTWALRINNLTKKPVTVRTAPISGDRGIACGSIILAEGDIVTCTDSVSVFVTDEIFTPYK